MTANNNVHTNNSNAADASATSIAKNNNNTLIPNDKWSNVINVHLSMIHHYILHNDWQPALVTIFQTSQLCRDLGIDIDMNYEIITPNIDIIVAMDDNLQELWEDLGDSFEDCVMIKELQELEFPIDFDGKEERGDDNVPPHYHCACCGRCIDEDGNPLYQYVDDEDDEDEEDCTCDDEDGEDDDECCDDEIPDHYHCACCGRCVDEDGNPLFDENGKPLYNTDDKDVVEPTKDDGADNSDTNNEAKTTDPQTSPQTPPQTSPQTPPQTSQTESHCYCENDYSPNTFDGDCTYHAGDVFMNRYGQVIMVTKVPSSPWGDKYPVIRTLDSEECIVNANIWGEEEPSILDVAYWIFGGESDKYDKDSWLGRQRDKWREYVANNQLYYEN